MKNTVTSVTNPHARERMIAEFMLKMLEKYGDQIGLNSELAIHPATSEEKSSEVVGGEIINFN